MEKKDFIKINDYLWEIPKSYREDMRVPARVYASEKMLEDIFRDRSLAQLINLCCLPGIQKYGLAMPDCHEGYASPIGGVAAIRVSDGIISPGMQGYDVNCGMKLLTSDYLEKDIKPHLEDLASEIQKEVPSGLGRGRQIKLSIEQINKILEGGAKRLVEQGYGEKEDIENCEAGGRLDWADASTVSERAKNRGRDQVGTLGSGNHFTEVQKVEEIFNEKIAEIFGLFKNQVVIMIHTGSRGLGHQVATDYIREFMRLMEKYKIRVPDREFACVPFNSPEGQRGLAASACAANYAWANRQMITHYVRKAWKAVLGEKASSLTALYDVAHNIIKKERYIIDGKETEVAVHRKGATRAFPPGHLEIPERYRECGQPVLIPGSMGTASYVLAGTEGGKEAFFSTCFTGDTKIITDKGIFTLNDAYKKFSQQNFLTPSLNLKSLSIEWKPIERVIRRYGSPIEISVSQTGRSKSSRLKVTPDHEFITITKGLLHRQKISDILKEERMVCVLDNLPFELKEKRSVPDLAYLMGALSSDGYISNNPIPRVMLIQKKTPQKMAFISTVQNCFYKTFGFSLEEKKTRRGGGIIRGRWIKGEATEFICHRKKPAVELIRIKNNLASWVLTLDKNSTLNFLAGIIDGDGSWNPFHKTLLIFSGKSYAVEAIGIACLKLGILPYVSEQRGSCKIIQISEKLDEINRFTKRVKIEPHSRKYGTKMFAIRQLFEGVESLRWPFLHKLARNNLMEARLIFNHFSKELATYSEKIQKRIRFFQNASFRMQRVRKMRDLDKQEVFNLTVQDNHNYFVLTETLIPILVGNCHGAGRTMSRHAAIRRFPGNEIVRDLEEKGIIVKCRSFRGIAEEAPLAYKNIDDVVEVVHQAGLSKKVARLVPLAVIKGE